MKPVTERQEKMLLDFYYNGHRTAINGGSHTIRGLVSKGLLAEVPADEQGYQVKFELTCEGIVYIEGKLTSSKE